MCQICQIANTPATHRFSVTRIVPRLPFQRLPTLRKLIATTVMSELVVHASLMARSAARLLNVGGGRKEKEKKKLKKTDPVRQLDPKNKLTNNNQK
jgi:hypothetical protein